MSNVIHMSPRDVAERLQLVKTRRGWRGTCPACGYEDTLLLSSKDGNASGWCASCHDRDAIQAKLREIGAGAGDVAPFVPGKGRDPAAGVERALACWNGSASVEGSPAAAYLASRGLAHLVGSPALRWRTDCSHPEHNKARIPAMVALVQDGNGKPIAVHRTYLNNDGRKSGVNPGKASLGALEDGAIRLDPVAAEMVVGEGVETAASAGLLLGLPAWAAVSAGQMAAKLRLPPEVRSVIIAADRDKAGENAAVGSARRWKDEGRRVRIARPDLEGQDFNDVLMARVATEQRHGS